MKIRWIDAGRVSGLRSQSIYHGLGHAQKENSPNTIILSIPENPYMCVGYFQDPENELDLTYCKKNKLPIVRRQTGGGTVYIDNKQLFVQWIFQPNAIPQKVEQKFQLFIKPMVETYKFFGIDAYEYGGHDVHVNGKKIVGTGAARIGEAEVITGNFISDFSINHMVNALNLPNNMMRNEVHRGLNEYMSSMTDELKQVPDFESIKEVYKRKCEEIHSMDFYEDVFTDEELIEIEKQEAKLVDESWIFSIKQPTKQSRLIKIHTGVWIGGTTFEVDNIQVSVTLRINEGCMNFVKIDLENTKRSEVVDLLEIALTGLQLSVSNINSAINSFFKINGSDWSILSKEQWIEALTAIINEKKKISGG